MTPLNNRRYINYFIYLSIYLSIYVLITDSYRWQFVIDRRSYICLQVITLSVQRDMVHFPWTASRGPSALADIVVERTVRRIRPQICII